MSNDHVRNAPDGLDIEAARKAREHSEYTAPGHNVTERAAQMKIIKRQLLGVLIPVSIITIVSVLFYFFEVPAMNATGQHYYYHGTDEGPVGTYMGNLMLMVVPLLWMMVFLAYTLRTMNLPPKMDYASPLSGLGDVTHDEEWYQAVEKTEKMMVENFYTILMRVPKGRGNSDMKKVGGFDLSINVGSHTYLLRRLRWDELTEDQQKQIRDAEARDRRNNKIAFGAGFGAGVVIGSGGSVH